jgi:hypothetical protein
LFVEGLQPLKRPSIIFLCLATKKRKGDTKRPLSRINANHIEERHSVLVGLVRTIKKEKLRVSLKVGKRVGVSKKDCCNPTIWRKLDSAPKALLVELVGERLNWTLAFASIPTNLCDSIVDILPCSERTALPYKCLDLLWRKASIRKSCKL